MTQLTGKDILNILGEYKISPNIATVKRWMRKHEHQYIVINGHSVLTVSEDVGKKIIQYFKYKEAID